MLFVSFAIGAWIADRRARKDGIAPGLLWDIGLWCFIGGVIGARLLHMIVFPDPEPAGVGRQILRFFEIWKGGMIFYGGLIGGLIGYFFAYRRFVRPNKLTTLQIADIVAPSLALGVFFGRIGCFLNGCCYGGYAEVPQAMQFPGNSPPHRELVSHGYQTAFGFFLGGEREPQTVTRVEDSSPAHEAGLQPGDRIIKLGDLEIKAPLTLYRELAQWPQGEPLPLTVERGDRTEELVLPLPRSLPVHPTQLYNAIDGLLLFLVLLAYSPFRKRTGQVFALFLILYPISRFIMESMRTDIGTTVTGLTMSQNISVLTLVAGVALMAWLMKRPPTAPVTAKKSP
jgi:phosphatidylglycerol:prolipoprotein diacylglycerol transferase